MSELFWFLTFCFFFFYLPFKLWQAYENRKDDQQRIYRAERDREISNYVLQDSIGEALQLRSKVQSLETSVKYWQDLYFTHFSIVAEISQYIYFNNLDETPSGAHILSIIENEDEDEE